MNIVSFLRRQLTPVKALQAFHVLRQGAAILISVFLAKSVLPTEEIGTYEQLLFIGYSLSFFWLTGLTQSLLTVFPKIAEEKRPAFFLRTYLIFLGLALFLLLFLFVGRTFILELFIRQATLKYFGLFAVFLFINIPTYLLENFYLLQRKSGAIVVFGLFAFGFQIVAVLLPVWLGYPFEYSFYALIFLATLKHVWLLIFLLQNATWEQGEDQVISWIRIAIPLVLYALIGGLNPTFDNWLVNYTYQGDAAAFAVFRYGARELPFTMAMATAFGASMLPEVAAALEPSLERIKNKSLKLFHILFPLALVAVLTSKFLFPIVFSDEFRESAEIFNVYLLVLVSRLVFPHTILIGMGENKAVLKVSVLELILNVVLSFLFVSRFGLWGIALGTALAFILEKIWMVWYLYHRHGILPNKYISLKPYFIYTTLLIVAFFISYAN